MQDILWRVLFLSPGREDPHPPQAVPRTPSQGKVDPYSVIDITPIQLQQLEQQHAPLPSASSPAEPKEQEAEAQDGHAGPVGITSGYSVPVPCGYATPSGVPLLTPAYTTPVIIRHLSMDEDGKERYLKLWLFFSLSKIPLTAVGPRDTKLW